jgi:polyisoprenyl-teichoic acid--peptidoglycan teichoic acid transferase
VKRTQWILLAGVAVLFSVGYTITALINRPMGNALLLQTPTVVTNTPNVQIVSQQISPSPVAKATSVQTEAPAATPTILPTSVPKTCGNTGSMRLLVIGLTTPTDEEILGADAIRLVTVDFDRPSATVLTLPALLWVDASIPGSTSIERIQLATVYNRAYLAARGDPQQVRAQKATQAVAQVIIDNFAYPPDHYITVDDSAFIKYVDALGGIEIDLPEAVDGTAEEYGYYPAGPQLLDGTRALNFSRLFHPGGMYTYDVWGNMQRQNLVIRAILAAMLKPKNWPKIPDLVREARQAVITDMSINLTIDLACMAKEVGEDARMLAFSEEMVTLDRSGRMIPDIAAVKSLIAKMDDWQLRFDRKSLLQKGRFSRFAW